MEEVIDLANQNLENSLIVLHINNIDEISFRLSCDYTDIIRRQFIEGPLRIPIYHVKLYFFFNVNSKKNVQAHPRLH